jgi:hypothetical protein
MSYLDFVYSSVFIVSIADLFKKFFKSKNTPEDVKEKLKEFLSKSIGGNIILITASIYWILFPFVNGFLLYISHQSFIKVISYLWNS